MLAKFCHGSCHEVTYLAVYISYGSLIPKLKMNSCIVSNFFLYKMIVGLVFQCICGQLPRFFRNALFSALCAFEQRPYSWMLNCGFLICVTGPVILYLQSSSVPLFARCLISSFADLLLSHRTICERQGRKAEKLMLDGNFEWSKTMASRWTFHVN